VCIFQHKKFQLFVIQTCFLVLIKICGRIIVRSSFEPALGGLRFSNSSEPRIHSGLVWHVNFTVTTQSGECHWLAFLEVAVPRKVTQARRNPEFIRGWCGMSTLQPRLKSRFQEKHSKFTVTTQSGECHWLAFLEVAVPSLLYLFKYYSIVLTIPVLKLLSAFHKISLLFIIKFPCITKYQ